MPSDTRAALVERLNEVVARWRAEADRLHAAHSPEALDGDQPWASDYEGRGKRNAFRQCADEIAALTRSAPEERGEGERVRDLEEAAYAVYADACRTGQTFPALTRLSAALLEYHREDLEAMDAPASPPVPVGGQNWNPLTGPLHPDTDAEIGFAHRTAALAPAVAQGAEEPYDQIMNDLRRAVEFGDRLADPYAVHRAFEEAQRRVSALARPVAGSEGRDGPLWRAVRAAVLAGPDGHLADPAWIDQITGLHVPRILAALRGQEAES